MKSIKDFKLDSGEQINIRHLQSGDENMLCDYINALSSEKTFIRFQGETVSPEEEKLFVDEVIEKMERQKAVWLVMESKNAILGVANIELKDKTESHEGILGISISASKRGQGLGKILLEQIIQEASIKLPQLKIITLSVFEGNSLAYKLYQQVGFKEYGRLPKGIHYLGSYIDCILMYKEINKE